MNRLFGFFIIFFLFSGCYQSTLTPMMVAGPAAGAAQGRLASSLASTVVNYGVKESTGKTPLQHIIKRERDRIAKKVGSVEKVIVTTSNEIKSKVGQSSRKVVSIKKKNSKKLYASANKIKEITKETFAANKPRYSYWSKQK